MTDRNQAMRDDIAFMRGLAEAGRGNTLRGGSMMAASGLIFGTASLTIWAGLESGRASMDALSLVWPISGVLFFICLWLFLRGIPKGEGKASGNGMAWSSIGWAIFVCVVSLITIAVRTNQAAAAAGISPVILSLYGACWCIAGSVTRRRWPYGFGFASFAAALATAWAVPEGHLMFLLYALSLYGLAAAPGLYLMFKARAQG
jgi:hypothetical protein